MAFVAGIRERPDVIVVGTYPPILGLTALLIGKLHSCPVHHELPGFVRDVASRIGMVGPGLAYRALDAVTRWALHHSDVVVALSADMARHLVAKSVRPERIPDRSQTGRIRGPSCPPSA